MAVELTDTRRAQLIAELQALFDAEFEETLSDFRAARILDFFLAALGPQVYNQAVQDARVFFQQKLDDLDGEVFQLEKT
jgi:uncharacterized protein (DUF2164 family)